MLEGVARGVELHLGAWNGKVDFSITPMDDFDIVLGMEFMRKHKAFPLPSCNALCILEGKTCMIPTISTDTYGHLSAMQLVEDKKGGVLSQPKGTTPPKPSRKDDGKGRTKPPTKVSSPKLPKREKATSDSDNGFYDTFGMEAKPIRGNGTSQGENQWSSKGYLSKWEDKHSSEGHLNKWDKHSRSKARWEPNTSLSDRGSSFEEHRRGRRWNRWGRMSRTAQFDENLYTKVWAMCRELKACGETWRGIRNHMGASRMVRSFLEACGTFRSLMEESRTMWKYLESCGKT